MEQRQVDKDPKKVALAVPAEAEWVVRLRQDRAETAYV
jgi:hypothetical protein